MEQLITKEDFYNSIKSYVASLSIGNRNTDFVPTDSMKKNGVILKENVTTIYSPGKITDTWKKDYDHKGMENEQASLTSNTVKIYTSENIPGKYTKNASITDSNRIENDLNYFINTYIETYLGNSKYISMLQLFNIIAYIRIFLGKRLACFSDALETTDSLVLLYNTDDIKDYGITISQTNDNTISLTSITRCIDMLTDELKNSNMVTPLAAVATGTSSSSSSSSSSCSSSSCSSSCSSSSCSSSSSWFIAYLL